MGTISVLLSTYNGEKYIIEQLESLKNQTRKIDSVIIKDDCSTDNTVKLIRQFLGKNNLDRWKLIINEENLGWRKNFVSLLDYVDTEHFFFCDQDDIWHLDKIEKMAAVMEGDTRIEILVSKFYPFYEDGRKSRKSDCLSGQVQKLEQKNFLLNKFPGCTMCIKSSLIPAYKKYWSKDIPHDSFAMLYGLARHSIYVYDYFTIHYRRHAQTATHPTILNREERIHEAEYYLRLVQLYQDISHARPDDIKCVKEWVTVRRDALYKRNPLILLKNIKNLNLYWSLQTYIMDWICAMGLY